MTKKADVSLVMQVVLVLFVFGIVLLFVFNVGEKATEVYSNVKAHLVAENVATKVNALSSMEQGQASIDFAGAFWDIEIYLKRSFFCKLGLKDCGYFVKVSHDKFENEVKILGDVKETKLYTVGDVKIIKDLDTVVRIEQV